MVNYRRDRNRDVGERAKIRRMTCVTLAVGIHTVYSCNEQWYKIWNALNSVLCDNIVYKKQVPAHYNLLTLKSTRNLLNCSALLCSIKKSHNPISTPFRILYSTIPSISVNTFKKHYYYKIVHSCIHLYKSRTPTKLYPC